MDKASFIGSLLGVGACLWVGYRGSHGHWAMFYSEKGMVMVIGGTISVILMAMPGDKLALRSSEEIINGEMMLQGLPSLQSGDNPRVTLKKMITFIPYSNRDKMKVAA
jgi:flagellar motor component MotA